MDANKAKVDLQSFRHTWVPRNHALDRQKSIAILFIFFFLFNDFFLFRASEKSTEK